MQSSMLAVPEPRAVARTCRRGGRSGHPVQSRSRWWLQPPTSTNGAVLQGTLPSPSSCCPSASSSSHVATHAATPRKGQGVPTPTAAGMGCTSTRQPMLCRIGRLGQEIEEDTPQMGSNPLLGGNPYWWEELEDGYEENDNKDLNLLTPDEVDDRVEEAAALISVLDDLQPMQQEGHNAFAEVWTRLVRIPPSARVRLVDEVEPGALRGLWRATMSRYVLADGLARHLLGSFSVLNDFPSQPGQVAVYEGCAERWQFAPPETKFSVDQAMQGRYPRSAPWLKPNQGQVLASRKYFTLHFFLHPRTGAMHGRVVLPLLGPIPNPWAPLYCRVRPSLVLTPLDSDAGADMTLEYGPLEAARQDAAQQGTGAGADLGPPRSGSFRDQLGMEEEGVWEGEYEGEELRADDLPRGGWPQPLPDNLMPLSPFSGTPRDYVRVAGPGVYVGCGYPLTAQGVPDKDACTYFMLVRKT